MPFAFGVDETGMPDAEARARLNKAMAVAERIHSLSSVAIFLGAGMPEHTKLRGFDSLAASAGEYLWKKGWHSGVIKKPSGYSTLTEVLAFHDYMNGLEMIHSVIHAVTSWWHLPRVWIVCRLIFGKSVNVHASHSCHSGRVLIYDILREIHALPRSAFMAWRAVRKLAA